MTTQYTPTLKLALPVTGELSGTWGDVVNDNITSMVEQAIAGLSTINTWTTNAHTLTTANGTTSESRCAMLVAATGGGAPTAAAEIICPAAAKLYVLQNNTSYAVTLKTSAGTGVAVAAGDTAFLFCDGTNVNSCVTTIVNGHITGNLTVDGNTTLGNATSDTITATARFASGLIPSADNTYDLGSSANSWKDLYIDGTATIATLNVTTIDTTNLEVTNIKAKDGTAAMSIADSTGVVSVTAAPVLTALTASQAVFTNGSKALVSNAITGTGNVVMSTSPTLVTPALGTPSSGVVTNLTGTASININGTVGATTPTTGVFTALSSTGQTRVKGAVSTNETGLALGYSGSSVSLIGAWGAGGATRGILSFYLAEQAGAIGNEYMRLTDTGLAVTGGISATGAVTLSGGTANGVAYLNGSKVLTTGTALTFDGTTFSALSSGTTVVSSRGAAGQQAFVSAAGNAGTVGTSSFDMIQDASSIAYLYQRVNQPMVFGVNNSEAMRLTSTGLGIGTSSPTEKLEVVGGNIKTDSTSRQIGYWEADAVHDGYFVPYNASGQSELINSFATGAVLFKTGTSKLERMRLDASGNLGIGTSSPSNKLEVSEAGTGGGLGGITAATATAGGNAGYLFRTGGSNRWSLSVVGSAGAEALRFYDVNNSSTRMTLDASGNLGIGTTTPATILQASLSSSSTGLVVAGAVPTIVVYDSSGTTGKAFFGQIDATTYLYNAEAGPLLFGTSNAEKMRLDASGNLGLGVTPSAWTEPALQMKNGGMVAMAGPYAHFMANAFYGSATWTYTTTAAASRYTQQLGAHQWLTAPSGTAGNAITFTQAMTLDASGNLLVGTTTASSSPANGFTVTGGAAVTVIGIGHVTGSGSGTYYAVFNYNGTAIGSITQDGTTAVLYNTTSDQRLKENIQDAAPASALIDAIQVRQFDWQSDGSHQRYGFVAQELVAVAPEAVHAPADPDEMMAVDYSKLVPLLVKEIQSLRARVAQLESKP